MKTHRKPKTAERKHSVQELEERLGRFRFATGPLDYARYGGVVAEAHALYNDSFQLRKQDPHNDHLLELSRRAIRLWQQAIAMAYPAELFEATERLRAGDPSGMEEVIRFLEADPIFFRTGYLKAKLIRLIRPEMLTEQDRKRLQQVVLHVVDTRDDRDFRAFCRLARKVDGPWLRTQLENRLATPDANVRRRARWVLEALTG